MFHVEQYTRSLLMNIDPELCHLSEKFTIYAELISRFNKQFNLTGNDDITVLLNDLITDSIEPLFHLNVPRGTSILDIGSGNGVPGVPAALFLDTSDFLLMDSSSKKVSFLDHVINVLNINNATTLCSRAEYSFLNYYEHFGLVLMRGVGNPYLSIELSSPFIKPGGSFLLFSNIHPDDYPLEMKTRMEELSIEFNCLMTSKLNKAVLFNKNSSLSSWKTKRFALIKRESRRIFSQ